MVEDRRRWMESKQSHGCFWSCRFDLPSEDMAALDGLEAGLATGWNLMRDHAV